MRCAVTRARPAVTRRYGCGTWRGLHYAVRGSRYGTYKRATIRVCHAMCALQ